jgi:cyclic-di-AMP phosphodiesterase PgpH
MLADAVEAAVRSLTRPTPDRIEEVVRRLIREKLEDGQLDECGLTFSDLNRIAGAFVRIMSGVLHPRLEYPDLERELTRRRRDPMARVR